MTKITQPTIAPRQEIHTRANQGTSTPDSTSRKSRFDDAGEVALTSRKSRSHDGGGKLRAGTEQLGKLLAGRMKAEVSKHLTAENVAKAGMAVGKIVVKSAPAMAAGPQAFAAAVMVNGGKELASKGAAKVQEKLADPEFQAKVALEGAKMVTEAFSSQPSGIKGKPPILSVTNSLVGRSCTGMRLPMPNLRSEIISHYRRLTSLLAVRAGGNKTLSVSLTVGVANPRRVSPCLWFVPYPTAKCITVSRLGVARARG